MKNIRNHGNSIKSGTQNLEPEYANKSQKSTITQESIVGDKKVNFNEKMSSDQLDQSKSSIS